MAVVGYVRLGKDGEDARAQNDISSVLGVDAIYQDRHRQRSRPNLQSCLLALRPGDCLVVTQLAQFGMGIGQLLKLIADLRARGCHLAAINDRIDTRDAQGWEFYRHALLLLATERELAREHADAEFISIGPIRGRNGGRRQKLTPAQVIEAQRMLWSMPARTRIADVAKRFGVARSTFYKTVIAAPEPDWINAP